MNVDVWIKEMSECEVPLFWMHEVSGGMKEIVMGFLGDKKLTEDHMKVLRWYLIQWIEKLPVFRPEDYKEKINNATQKELSDYIGVLLDYGIDPF